MARHSDFRNGVEKQATREQTLEVVRQCPMLWQGDRLLYDWMELSAHGDPALQLLANKGALGPGRFIGITREREVITLNTEDFKHLVDKRHALFLEGEIGTQIINLSNFPKVGVLVFDGYTSVANATLEQTLQLLFNFAEARARQIGQVVLVTNLVQRNTTRSKLVDLDESRAKYKKMLCSRLGFLIPEEHFRYYKDKGRVFPMMLHRVVVNTTPNPPRILNTTIWNLPPLGATLCEVS